MMRGSLVHDAFYQLLRDGRLPLDVRDQVDALFRRLCREDGLSSALAWGAYQLARNFGAAYATPAAKKESPRSPVECGVGEG